MRSRDLSVLNSSLILVRELLKLNDRKQEILQEITTRELSGNPLILFGQTAEN
jgi:hypothetical protein